MEKITKKSYLENNKDVSIQIGRQNLQLLIVPWQSLYTEENFFSILRNFLYPSYLKKFEKTYSSYLKNYKKLSLQTQSQDSKTAESTLTDSKNMIEIFKLLEFFNIWVFLKISEKYIKNVISRKLLGSEQS